MKDCQRNSDGRKAQWGGKPPASFSSALRRRDPRVLVLALLMLVCACLTSYCHFVWRTDIVFSHLFYLPIILAAFWWWRRCIWVAAILGGWLVASHLLSGLHEPLGSDLLRAAMFVLVGLVTGTLSERCYEAKQTAMRKAKDYLDNLIRHASVPIIVWDRYGRITLFNSAFEQLTGYDAVEIMGRQLDFLFPEDGREESFQKIESTLTGEYWRAVEIPILSRDGRISICLWNSANIYEADGKTLMATMAQGQDITDRKRAEEGLSRSEKQYRTMIEKTHDWVWTLDREGLFTFCNPRAEEVSGYLNGAVLGKPFASAMSSDDFLRVSRIFQETLAGKAQTYDVAVNCASGRLVELSVNTAPIFEGDEVVGTVSFGRDITARKKAEEAYRSLVEGSLQGFLILQDGVIVFANSALVEMVGYSVEEFEAMSRKEVIVSVHPDDRQMVWSRYADRLAGKETPPRYEFRLIRKDGGLCWVEMVATTIELGGRPATQAALMNITERVHHEREQRAIVTVATSMRAAETRSELVTLLLEQVIQVLDADGVALAIRDPANGDSVFETALGLWENVVGGRIPAGEGLTGWVMASGKPYLNNNVSEDDRLAFVDVLSTTRAVAGAPLIAVDETIGVLWMGRRTEIGEDDWLLLTAIAEMTASALRRIGLHEEVERSHLELTEAYDSTLEGWARALELRDSDTEGHTRRVVELTQRLGMLLGMSGGELVHLRRGALLHDIGKMAIPDEILRKPGTLDDHEWEIMRRHPVYAHEMLSQISYLRPALDIPYCHHERWDGTGYPRGCAGEEIPLAARIFAVVDVWDALRSDRPYRPAWSEEETVAYLRTESGSHFDPKIVKVLLEIVDWVPG
ncbi:MAG: PAS domain S-box protein [Thermoanaerobaculales bacterium]|nr:PAS domain S-box protein [Thermoanaerobaculales bacterium]